MAAVQFFIPDIDCDACAQSIKKAIEPVEGVERVAVDVADRQVIVAYDAGRTEPGALEEKLERAGFFPESRTESEFPEAER